MPLSDTLPVLVLSAVAMSVALLALVPIATRIGLVDVADGHRKHHEGAIPLVGGPALFVVLLLGAALLGDFEGARTKVLLSVAALTVAIGALDDCLDLSATVRLLVQLVLASIVVFEADVTISHLGDLAGTGATLHLGPAAPWISIAALAAAMNAFNMLDGIDGQAAGLAWIAALAIGLSAIALGRTPPLEALLLAGALPAFLLFNMRRPGGVLPKCFLGDSGALLIGLLVGVLLIRSSNAQTGWVDPITVLWFAALPLFDTLFVMGFRALQLRSPLGADRNHLHHLLKDRGHSNLGAVGIAFVLASSIAACGLLLEILEVAEMGRFVALFVVFLVYIATAHTLHRRRPEALAAAPETPLGQE